MDHFVKLDRLPEGVEFPPQLKDRIHFDPVAAQAGLPRLHEQDRLRPSVPAQQRLGFRRTLEELFRLSSPGR